MQHGPLKMREAAVLLGVSYRTMIDVVKNLTPTVHFDERGARRVFYPDQIERIRRDGWASRSNGAALSRGPMEPCEANAYGKALELATQAKRKKPEPTLRRASGGKVSTVIRR